MLNVIITHVKQHDHPERTALIQFAMTVAYGHFIFLSHKQEWWSGANLKASKPPGLRKYFKWKLLFLGVSVCVCVLTKHRTRLTLRAKPVFRLTDLGARLIDLQMFALEIVHVFKTCRVRQKNDSKCTINKDKRSERVTANGATYRCCYWRSAATCCLDYLNISLCSSSLMAFHEARRRSSLFFWNVKLQTGGKWKRKYSS